MTAPALLALDPGSEYSALVRWDGTAISIKEYSDNAEILALLRERRGSNEPLAIEALAVTAAEVLMGTQIITEGEKRTWLRCSSAEFHLKSGNKNSLNASPSLTFSRPRSSAILETVLEVMAGCTSRK